ncbi:MAG: hypothetical protein WKF78_02700 [Candidatus Limnocylindrales bacterium]
MRGCDIPSTIIATGYSAADYQKYADENPEWAFLAGIPELRNLSWVDLPTSHWPMWSKPAELAKIIGDIATKPPATPTHDDAPPRRLRPSHLGHGAAARRLRRPSHKSNSGPRRPARTARSSTPCDTWSGRTAGT